MRFSRGPVLYRKQRVLTSCRNAVYAGMPSVTHVIGNVAATTVASWA